MRRGGVEGHGVACYQSQRFESDDGFDLTLQDVQVFAAVVAQRPAVLGGLTAGFVDNLDEVDPAVMVRREALPADARRKFDGVAVAGPLHDACPLGAAGTTPWAGLAVRRRFPADPRQSRQLARLDVARAEQEIQ